jgi:hypothetical protein
MSTIMKQDVIREDVIRIRGLNKYNDKCGAVPARNEMAEIYGVANADRFLSDMFEKPVESPRIGEWRDAVIEVPGVDGLFDDTILELRIPRESSIEAPRPAYNDTVTMSSIEYALAYHAHAMCFWANVLPQQEGNSIRLGLFNVTAEWASNQYHAARHVIMNNDLMNAHRWLD